MEGWLFDPISVRRAARTISLVQNNTESANTQLPSDPAFFDYPDDVVSHLDPALHLGWISPDIRVRRYDEEGTPQPVTLGELVRLTQERSDLRIDDQRLEVRNDDRWLLAFELSNWVRLSIGSGRQNLIDHVEFQVASRVATSDDLAQWAADVYEYTQRGSGAIADDRLNKAIAEKTTTISQWYHEISATTPASVGQQPPPPDPLIDDWGYSVHEGVGFPELRHWITTVLNELRANEPEPTVFTAESLADETLDRNTNLMTTEVDDVISPIQHEIANQLGGHLVSAREARQNLIRTGEVVLTDEDLAIIRYRVRLGGERGAELAGLVDGRPKKRRSWSFADVIPPCLVRHGYVSNDVGAYKVPVDEHHAAWVRIAPDHRAELADATGVRVWFAIERVDIAALWNELEPATGFRTSTEGFVSELAAGETFFGQPTGQWIIDAHEPNDLVSWFDRWLPELRNACNHDFTGQFLTSHASTYSELISKMFDRMLAGWTEADELECLDRHRAQIEVLPKGDPMRGMLGSLINSVEQWVQANPHGRR